MVKRRKRTYTFCKPKRIIEDGWCHQCKFKKEKVIACDNFWKGNRKKCSGKYCEKCVFKVYNDDFEEMKTLKKWVCYSCQKRCTCYKCRSKREVSPKRLRKQKKKKNQENQEIETSSKSKIDGESDPEKNVKKNKKNKLRVREIKNDGKEKNFGESSSESEQVGEIYTVYHHLDLDAFSFPVHNCIALHVYYDSSLDKNPQLFL